MMKFKELVENNKQNIKNIIKLITKQENEDLEQEVYIRAWKNLDKYEEKGCFKSWICTVAKNISKDYLKSAQYKKSNNTTSDDYAISIITDKKQTPDTKAISGERQARIINAIESLKPKLKEVIILCEIQGYTYEEASKKLKCPLGTIKSRIYNAKKHLAEILEDLL
ncbi:sigma-70 family RNA polymerase sigma factor [bacterium]|nr:sigma-70 family RNA polymerase sigma factor [bacterium]